MIWSVILRMYKNRCIGPKERKVHVWNIMSIDYGRDLWNVIDSSLLTGYDLIINASVRFDNWLFAFSVFLCNECRSWNDSWKENCSREVVLVFGQRNLLCDLNESFRFMNECWFCKSWILLKISYNFLF